ncbi:MAG: hypothetical protein M3R69_11670 [Acidobacteriota bacterium]|nr:hypothetical protein [Acidobacteriota bacterium]
MTHQRFFEQIPSGALVTSEKGAQLADAREQGTAKTNICYLGYIVGRALTVFDKAAAVNN